MERSIDEMERTGYYPRMVVPGSMKNYIFTGLKTSPSRLKETMIPNISPETVADTKVQVSGGYETCQFGVSVDTFTVELS